AVVDHVQGVGRGQVRHPVGVGRPGERADQGRRTGGDLTETLLTLLVSLEKIDLHFSYHSDRGEFSISSGAVRAQAGALHFSHPDVYRFLKEYIREGLEQVLTLTA
ncbi:MAG TPA: hypothetical protein VLQ89_04190, partial [Candidatus Binatia bacterium]|nr:hypothetical protein [Candidatus Binatia bacterium]